jgi:hypothetical protein
MSKERGRQGIRRRSATVRAARWLAVSRPPVSMSTSSYVPANRWVSVRTALPVNLILVYPAPPVKRSLRRIVKSLAVSWSSASMSRTSWPSAARMMARVVAMVVLPLPPFVPPATRIIAISFSHEYDIKIILM